MKIARSGKKNRGESTDLPTVQEVNGDAYDEAEGEEGEDDDDDGPQ